MEIHHDFPQAFSSIRTTIQRTIERDQTTFIFNFSTRSIGDLPRRSSVRARRLASPRLLLGGVHGVVRGEPPSIEDLRGFETATCGPKLATRGARRRRSRRRARRGSTFGQGRGPRPPRRNAAAHAPLLASSGRGGRFPGRPSRESPQNPGVFTDRAVRSYRTAGTADRYADSVAAQVEPFSPRRPLVCATPSWVSAVGSGGGPPGPCLCPTRVGSDRYHAALFGGRRFR